MSFKQYIRILIFGAAIILGGVALVNSDLPKFQADKLKTEILVREYYALLDQGKIDPVNFPCKGASKLLSGLSSSQHEDYIKHQKYHVDMPNAKYRLPDGKILGFEFPASSTSALPEKTKLDYPIAEYQLSDGRIARFEVPEGTTPEQDQRLLDPIATQIDNWHKPEYLAMCLEHDRPELYSQIIKSHQHELEKAAADFYETESLERLPDILLKSLISIVALSLILALISVILRLVYVYREAASAISTSFWQTLKSLMSAYWQILKSSPCHWGFFIVPALATIIVTLFPTEEYEYYQLLRIIVCFSAAWVAHCEYKEHASITNFVKLFAAVALLYNPIFVVHLSRDIWFSLNLVVVGLFLYYPIKSAGKSVSLSRKQKIGAIAALVVLISLMYIFQNEFCRRCDDGRIKSLIR